MSVREIPALLLRPEGSAWADLVTRTADERSMAARRELGLPVDRPIVMTGHQAEFWHAGILAKYLAADALATRTGAAVVWVVVDQDRRETVAVRYPAVDERGELVARRMELSAREVVEVPSDVHPAARGGLERIVRAFGGTRSADRLAVRVTAAMRALLGPMLTHEPTVVYASELGASAAVGELVERMVADPQRCVSAYNAAAAETPGARVRALATVGGSLEMPMWVVKPSGVRGPASTTDLGAVPRERLMPKALTMTAALRMRLCDLFIHGTGGGADGASGDADDDGYDRVMRRWLELWTGGATPARGLAPAVVASATRRVALDDAAPTPSAIARAAWLAHRARHDPAVLGDARVEEHGRVVTRLSLVSSRVERAGLFAQLHALLADYRGRQAVRLAELEASAAGMRAQRARAAVAHDRTWPWPMVAEAEVRALAAEIAGAVG
jgi:hypothetical protein